MKEDILRIVPSSVKRNGKSLIWHLQKWIAYSLHPSYYCLCQDAKKFYKTWSETFSDKSQGLVHPLWLGFQPIFAQLVLGGVPYDFLRYPVVGKVFYRAGFGEPQQHELAYLRNTRSEIWNAVEEYRESPIGRPIIDCPELEISVNSLGMLYYFARIAEQLDTSCLSTIVEFGGGYGSLCRVFLESLPLPPTYVIVDLPEMLALQYVFLRGSSSDYRVIAHTSLPVDLRENYVNLVPVHWAKEATLQCDVFISTFALSEAPRSTQRMVVEACLPNARAVYIVGQYPEADQWKSLSLERADVIHQSVRDTFLNVRLQPFHFADSWEVIAKKV